MMSVASKLLRYQLYHFFYLRFTGISLLNVIVISFYFRLKFQAGPRSAVGISQRFWVRYPVWPHTFVSPSAESRGAVVSYWRKYVHEVLVNRLGGLSLPRKSVIRLTGRPDMTLDVYRGRKTTTQHQHQLKFQYPKLSLYMMLFI